MQNLLTGLITATLLLCLPVIGSAADWPPQEALTVQAESFLERLDQGDFQGAWHLTTPLFMALTPAEPWISRQQTLRTVYGPLISRELKRVDYRTTFAHSPDSSYAIVQYNASFEHKAETVETIILDCPTATSCGVREYILR